MSSYLGKRSRKSAFQSTKRHRFITSEGVFLTRIDQTWLEKLEKVRIYLDINRKMPSKYSKDKSERSFACWIHNQRKCYKMKKNALINRYLCQIWETFIQEYAEYFMTYEEKWQEKLENLKNYIDKHGELPNMHSAYKKIAAMKKWIYQQNSTYKTHKNIMKSSKIRTLWADFLTEYSKYFKQ